MAIHAICCEKLNYLYSFGFYGTELQTNFFYRKHSGPSPLILRTQVENLVEHIVLQSKYSSPLIITDKWAEV